MECIEMNEFNNFEISIIFGIDLKTIYNWKKQYQNNTLYNNQNRKTKISPKIKLYIENYVTTRVNFNYKKLIVTIKKKFNIQISKTTIYHVLKEKKIKKKNFTIKLY